MMPTLGSGFILSFETARTGNVRIRTSMMMFAMEFPRKYWLMSMQVPSVIVGVHILFRGRHWKNDTRTTATHHPTAVVHKI